MAIGPHPRAASCNQKYGLCLITGLFFVEECNRIMSNDEQIIVIKNGEPVSSCKIQDFRRKPNSTFRILLSNV